MGSEVPVFGLSNNMNRAIITMYRRQEEHYPCKRRELRVGLLKFVMLLRTQEKTRAVKRSPELSRELGVGVHNERVHSKLQEGEDDWRAGEDPTETVGDTMCTTKENQVGPCA